VAKQQVLAGLFESPHNIPFNGSFEEAKDAAHAYCTHGHMAEPRTVSEGCSYCAGLMGMVKGTERVQQQSSRVWQGCLSPHMTSCSMVASKRQKRLRKARAAGW